MPGERDTDVAMTHQHHEPKPHRTGVRRVRPLWWVLGLTGLVLTLVGVAVSPATDALVRIRAVAGDRIAADGHRDGGRSEDRGKSVEERRAKPTGTPVPCGAEALIAAITLANARDGATLYLAEDCTYLLTVGIDGAGLPAITAPITLNGAKSTAIERAATADPFRILIVDTGGDLTLNRLTITGGRTLAGIPGGGVLVNAGGRLTARHSAIVRNISGGSSGGIANLGITAVEESTVTGNTAALGGGGIFNAGRLTVSKTRFTDNSALDVGGAIGTGEDGTAEVRDSTFIRNRARAGGGIGDFRAITTIVNSTFADNHASVAAGGIFAEGQLTMRNVTVVNNGGIQQAGGVNVQNSLGESAAVIEDSKIIENTTNGLAGGIFNVLAPTVLRNVTVAANHAALGGGVYNLANSTVTLYNTSVEKNTAITDGGGIFNAPGGVVVLNPATGTVVTKNRPNNCVNVPDCPG